jgi:hypothetical protein
MSRRTITTDDSPSSTVPVVDPNAVYFVDTLQRAFRLRKSTIRREWKEGRLRLAKRAGRYYVLGAWVLQWLQEGEMRNRRTPSPTGGQSA